VKTIKTTLEKPAASFQQPASGWSLQQLALVMMLFGVIAVVVALKCLLVGPPPYSMLAYIIGPCLIAGSYLVDPHALPDLLLECLNRARPPLTKGSSFRRNRGYS
jgi:hypothetical protein